jgi:SnoaL-like domain
MGRSIEQVAEAFSRHRFPDTYPHLAEHVRWTIVGDREITGREDVIDVCRQSAEYLAGVTSTFRKFKVVVGDDCAVVDSEAEYVDGDDSSVVASCDIYDFSGGRLTGITSYTIQLPPST